MLKKQTTIKHFHSHVITGPESECWLWTGPKTPAGYGTLKMMVHGVPLFLAHRVAWSLANEAPIPKGMHVLHSCDRPPCCNPSHLRLGTNAENVKDSVLKGRHFGKFHKIPAQAVAALRNDPSAIASIFGLSRRAVLRNLRLSREESARLKSESLRASWARRRAA